MENKLIKEYERPEAEEYEFRLGNNILSDPETIDENEGEW